MLASLARSAPAARAAAAAAAARLARASSSSAEAFGGAHSVRPCALSHELQFAEPGTEPGQPVFQLLGPDGRLVGRQAPAGLESPQRVRDLYKGMLTLNTIDRVLYDSQRQGRISFYMTNYGEEAAQVGSAAALGPRDWVFAQYREAGVLLQRGAHIRQLLAQCFGNCHDPARGRQMPVHYGSRELRYVTISSPLATQLPQAAGAAYALRLQAAAQRQPEPAATICYFGEGAASEGDAHAAMNFASTLDCPVVFFCRNNGYAISTPAAEQFRGDGIAGRARALGIDTVRVDGADLLAVFAATAEARRRAVQLRRPTLIEALTYRLGHHSTSDDSSAYRAPEELASQERSGRPLERVRAYLEAAGAWCERDEEQCRQEARREVLEALSWAEAEPRPPVSSMFEDVYDQLPAHLTRQRAHLAAHLGSHGQHYGLDKYQGL